MVGLFLCILGMETPFIRNITVLIFDNKNIIIRYRLENNVTITNRHSFFFLSISYTCGGGTLFEGVSLYMAR